MVPFIWQRGDIVSITDNSIVVIITFRYKEYAS